jgi:NAD(P)-dependent dehydrogenase (short-subunit alcohol dehydrogenase family)
MELADKVALVTGGASGLGRATALALAEAGCEVVVADLDEAGAREVAERVGGRFWVGDVSSYEANRELMSFVGELDIAYLNAGVASGFSLGDDFDLDRYRLAMGVNLDGVVFGTHHALPLLKARGGGAIVATASLAGLTSDGITFNAICPGFAESKIVDPIREILDAQGVQLIPAETVARTVLRIIADGATGEAWFVQPGREPAPFQFRNVPGPGTGEAARPDAI